MKGTKAVKWHRHSPQKRRTLEAQPPAPKLKRRPRVAAVPSVAYLNAQGFGLWMWDNLSRRHVSRCGRFVLGWATDPQGGGCAAIVAADTGEVLKELWERAGRKKAAATVVRALRVSDAGDDEDEREDAEIREARIVTAMGGKAKIKISSGQDPRTGEPQV